MVWNLQKWAGRQLLGKNLQMLFHALRNNKEIYCKPNLPTNFCTELMKIKGSKGTNSAMIITIITKFELSVTPKAKFHWECPIGNWKRLRY